MARSITEVGPGDYVKVGPNRYEEIAHIEKEYDDRLPLPGVIPKRWTVITTSGRHIGMFKAGSYHKKEDLQKTESNS